jgi:hypothetical protein
LTVGARLAALRMLTSRVTADAAHEPKAAARMAAAQVRMSCHACEKRDAVRVLLTAIVTCAHRDPRLPRLWAAFLAFGFEAGAGTASPFSVG